MSAWGKAWAKAWGAAWGVVESVVVSAVDGGRKKRGKRIERRPAKPLDTYRTPEDIRREQLETEQYLAEVENRKAPATVVPKADRADVPVVAQPILADVAARAASAAQAKIREAAEAAAASRLAQDKRRRTLALLLALD